MRMWCVDPKCMCDKHLLGEHLECHMFMGSILKRRSLEGYIQKGFLDTTLLLSRHEELAIEMQHRGMHHASPLDSDPLNYVRPVGAICPEKNLLELIQRCPNCYIRYMKHNQLKFDFNLEPYQEIVIRSAHVRPIQNRRVRCK